MQLLHHRSEHHIEPDVGYRASRSGASLCVRPGNGDVGLSLWVFQIKTRYVDADRGEIFAVSEEYRQLVGHKSHQDHGGFDASQIRARPEMTLPLSSRWSWLWRKQVPATCGERQSANPRTR